jgi:hypothetical protein
MDRGEEILYKAFELDPLAKMSVEVGKKKTELVLDTLEYLGSLTIPRDMSWAGVDKKITPLDPDTALFVRDHSVYSNIRRTIDHGVAHQYGQVLISGTSASESLVGAASAIAHVERDEQDNIKIYRKKQMGMENKHARDLVPEFHGVSTRTVDRLEGKKEEDVKEEPTAEPPWEQGQDHETQMMAKILEKEKKPPLKEEEEKPPLKKSPDEVMLRDDEYDPPWEG